MRYSKVSPLTKTGWSSHSSCGFSCLKCKLPGWKPHLMLCSTFMKDVTPATSTPLPTKLFVLVINKVSLSSPLRKACPQELTSTASPRRVPTPCVSTASTSSGVMPALRQASTRTCCSAGPCGAVKLALLPLLLFEPPEISPTGESSPPTSPPSAFPSKARTTAAAHPSLRTYPFAEASNVKHRPPGQRKPEAECAGHHTFARTMCTPLATATSWMGARPFFSTDSAAQYSAVNDDAASVSIDIHVPLRPRQKLTRPAVIAGELPVAPKMPMSMVRSA
mmetsp:Transcript_54288/g.151072  ORF Transcript_54288/g.151072 Transcript_54288/m.151072 type:complete len:278 (+) Transcript_54288:753-1586(+)